MFNNGEIKEDEELNIEIIDDEFSNIKLSISAPSIAFQVFLGRFPTQNLLTLKILDSQVNNHGQALTLLEKISNSLFFQIDMASNVPLALVRYRRNRLLFRFSSTNSNPNITFPKSEYDSAPIALYWYARSANGMPLLQFLAYYQVLEYYFFVYSQDEAKRKIRSVLKDPTFRFDRETDLVKILSAVKIHGRGFGDEKSQLRAVLNACLDQEDIKDFICGTEEREKFFSEKHKGLSEYKISQNSKDTDLKNEITNIVYDIRCKIVHTKGDGNSGDIELLLPFTKEADLLYQYNQLMQYLARQVLINSSSSLQI
jgi:hypothetical protein